jgi:hypothetical protein
MLKEPVFQFLIYVQLSIPMEPVLPAIQVMIWLRVLAIIHHQTLLNQLIWDVPLGI